MRSWKFLAAYGRIRAKSSPRDDIAIFQCAAPRSVQTKTPAATRIPGVSLDKSRILQTGRNCWRIRRADKVAFLIDGAAYFKTLYESLPLAEQQVLILSWDIYSQLHLVPPTAAFLQY